METNIFGTSTFTLLPDSVLFTNMPDKCKQLYAFLSQKAERKNDDCVINSLSYNELAKKLKCSTKSIQRHINRLKNFGLIEVERISGSYLRYIIVNQKENSIKENEQI